MSIFGMLDGVPDPLPTLIDEEDLLFGGEKTLLGILALLCSVQLCSQQSVSYHPRYYEYVSTLSSGTAAGTPAGASIIYARTPIA